MTSPFLKDSVQSSHFFYIRWESSDDESFLTQGVMFLSLLQKRYTGGWAERQLGYQSYEGV